MIKKKTVELTTLPNTEVFGLYNCMVKPDSIADDIEKRTRKFTITPLYNTASVVGIGIEPFKYRISDSGEILNTLIHADNLKLKNIYSNAIQDGELLLDVTATEPYVVDATSIQYLKAAHITRGSEFNFNKNVLSDRVPDTINITIQKNNAGAAIFDTCYVIGVNFMYDNSNSLHCETPFIFDILINDNLIATVYNQNISNIRIISNRGVGGGICVSNNSGLGDDIFDRNTSLNIKLIKRDSVVKYGIRNVGISFSDKNGTFPDIFKSAIVTVGDESKIFNIKYSLNFVTPENPDTDVVIELYFKDDYSGDTNFLYDTVIPIIRYNASDNKYCYPEAENLGYSNIASEHFKYCIHGWDTNVNDERIKIVIPNRIIQSVPPCSTDMNLVIIGYIPKIGTFTTERPNTP